MGRGGQRLHAHHHAFGEDAIVSLFVPVWRIADGRVLVAEPRPVHRNSVSPVHELVRKGAKPLGQVPEREAGPKQGLVVFRPGMGIRMDDIELAKTQFNVHSVKFRAQ